MTGRALITGAFSNTGSAVARELLVRDWHVETLTNRAAPASSSIRAHELRFDREHLLRAMDGIDVFVNTYWVRFPHREVTFRTAIDNSRLLFDVAREAGVRRVVQVSVSNAESGDGLSYYEGKAEVDELLRASGLSHAIVRPTLIVGPNDVLTNNIAWFVRRLPLFGIPSGPGYRLQPVTLGDTGRIIADVVESADDLDIDAAGPEMFTFEEYVRLLATSMGRSLRTFPIPPRQVVRALGLFKPILRDTVLTFEELEGLRREMLVSRADPLGTEPVSQWLVEHGDAFGRAYANDTLTRFHTN